MKRAFTLIEMVIAVALTGLLLTTLYGMVNVLRTNTHHYRDALKKSRNSRDLHTLLLLDLLEIRGKLTVVREAGYDRFSFIGDHSVYGIPRPWIAYFISAKERALVRVEATSPVHFFTQSAGRRPLFFADVLAKGCNSLRLGEQYDRIDLMVRCRDIDPILLSIPKGTP